MKVKGKSSKPVPPIEVDVNGMPKRAWMSYSPAQRAYIVYPPSVMKIDKQSYPVGKHGLEGAWGLASRYLDRHRLAPHKRPAVSRVRERQYLLAGVYGSSRDGLKTEAFSAQKMNANTGAFSNQRFAIGGHLVEEGKSGGLGFLQNQ